MRESSVEEALIEMKIGARAVSDHRDEKAASIDHFGSENRKDQPQHILAVHPRAFKEVMEDNKESK